MPNNQSSEHSTLSKLTLSDKRRRQFTLGLSAIVGSVVANKLLDRNGLAVAFAYEAGPNGTRTSDRASVFTKKQMDTLKAICQTVIPATDTLGAGDVDTHGFIENQLSHCFEEDEIRSVVDSINNISLRAKTRYETDFENLDSAQATSLLVDLDSAKKEFSEQDKTAFRFVKSLIVFGYYTSEEGASNELTYDAYPGGYKGAVALSDVGSAWGSLAYF